MTMQINVLNTSSEIKIQEFNLVSNVDRRVIAEQEEKCVIGGFVLSCFECCLFIVFNIMI
jgi:hypothetical protein